jgi:hypothetical protein
MAGLKAWCHGVSLEGEDHGAGGGICRHDKERAQRWRTDKKQGKKSLRMSFPELGIIKKKLDKGQYSGGKLEGGIASKLKRWIPRNFRDRKRNALGKSKNRRALRFARVWVAFRSVVRVGVIDAQRYSDCPSKFVGFPRLFFSYLWLFVSFV